MRKIRYIVKEVGKDFEIKEHDDSYMPKEEIGCEYTDSYSFGNGIYCLFDDLGFSNYMNGKSKYNFNVPSYSAIENKIFGKAIFIRANNLGYDIDIIDSDLDFIKNHTFYRDVSEEYIKSMNEVISDLKNAFNNFE